MFLHWHLLMTKKKGNVNKIKNDEIHSFVSVFKLSIHQQNNSRHSAITFRHYYYSAVKKTPRNKHATLERTNTKRVTLMFYHLIPGARSDTVQIFILLDVSSRLVLKTKAPVIHATPLQMLSNPQHPSKHLYMGSTHLVGPSGT